jgi:hypothetical protein
VGYLDPKGELGAIYGTLNKYPIMRFTGLLIPARANYWEQIKMEPNFTDPLVKMKGRKFYADGSIQLGTGFMRDEYRNVEYGRGFPNYTK